MNWTLMECGKCGIHFQVTEKWDSDKRASGETFYCPNGHPRVYRETTVDKLRRERDIAQQQLARAEDEKRHAERRAEAEAAMRRTADAAVKRLRKRASAGTCPCCNRTFGNMATHMKKQHPEFVAENVVRLKST